VLLTVTNSVFSHWFQVKKHDDDTMSSCLQTGMIRSVDCITCILVIRCRHSIEVVPSYRMSSLKSSRCWGISPWTLCYFTKKQNNTLATWWYLHLDGNKGPQYAVDSAKTLVSSPLSFGALGYCSINLHIRASKFIILKKLVTCIHDISSSLFLPQHSACFGLVTTLTHRKTA
jgi:hypothetical protein